MDANINASGGSPRAKETFCKKFLWTLQKLLLGFASFNLKNALASKKQIPRKILRGKEKFNSPYFKTSPESKTQ
ncbi:hypothetical protein D0S45_02115 [Marinifilum sp. JC120]|nr:hypothetical protein D0S45_02115 [Marinifilum sp. JC120]